MARSTKPSLNQKAANRVVTAEAGFNQKVANRIAAQVIPIILAAIVGYVTWVVVVLVCGQ